MLSCVGPHWLGRTLGIVVRAIKLHCSSQETLRLRHVATGMGDRPFAPVLAVPAVTEMA